MFENIMKLFKRFSKEKTVDSKNTAKERLQLVLTQDRANVSADFLELMRHEIIEVIKKYVDVDESAINVTLTNKTNSDGTIGAPALYADIPIVSIKDGSRKMSVPKEENKQEESKTEKLEEKQEKQEEPIEQVEEIEEEKIEETHTEEKSDHQTVEEDKEEDKIEVE